MRKLLPTLAVVCSVLFASVPEPVGAMMADPTVGLQAPAAEPVVYICKQRYWSGKRYCYWRPGGYRWRWRWHFPRWWR